MNFLRKILTLVNFLIIEGMIICRAESDKQSFFIVKVEMNELVS